MISTAFRSTCASMVLLLGLGSGARAQSVAEGNLVGVVDSGLPTALAAATADVAILVTLPSFGNVELELRPRSVVADGFVAEAAHVSDGKVVSRALDLPLPRVFTGSVRGMPGSHAFIGLGTGRGSQLAVGFVEIDGTTWWISSGPLEARRAGMPVTVSHSLAFAGADAKNFVCGASGAPTAELSDASGAIGGVASGASICGEYQVAIDTDTEFTMTAHGGNVVEAGQYALLLMAAASEVYERDVGVSLTVPYLRLWTGEDPWTHSAMGEQLGEFRTHWNRTMGGVSRHVAHYFAGRGLGGGVAWLNVVCGNRDYAYGLSSRLGYGFPYPLVDHSNANWEPIVVMHELGHNFGAPHTHDHNPPVDACGLDDCSSSFGGTLMSYCGGCPGGLSNLRLGMHPVSVASIHSHLAGTPCSSAATGALADSLFTVAGTAATVYPLANDSFANCGRVALAGFSPVSAAGGPVTVIDAESASPLLRYQPPYGFVGTDSFTYSATLASGMTSSATVHAHVLQREHVIGASPGIRASWYAVPSGISSLPDFATMTPYGSEVLSELNFPATGGVFASSGRADLVAAVFEGYLQVPSPGMWQLSLESDDGSRLLLGGAVLIDNDGLHAMQERTASLMLQAGTYPIRVEYFENGGGAGLILRWAGPGVPLQVIPSGSLVHAGTAVQIDLNGDGVVNGLDLTALLSNWGGSGIGDIDGSGVVDGFDLTLVLSAWNSGPGLPSVASVSPASGPTSGGTAITLTGTNFTGATSVTVGGAPVTNVQVVNATTVTAVTPAGTAGGRDVTITTPGGTAARIGGFTYVVPAPTLTAVSPASGPTSGGTTITLTGTNLTGATSVTVGGAAAASVQVVNATTVTAVTPPGTAGARDVRVTTPGGTAALAGGFTYATATVPSWATLVEAAPNPEVVTSPTLRAQITATGYAWRVRDTSTQIEFVLIPPGTFQMGCSVSNQYGCSSDESPVHTVTLTNALYMGRYEVTQAQWTARMGSNPSFFQAATAQVPTSQVSNRPVERVSWNTIQGFLSATGMRLPTEAEWEYAYRAGTTTAFHSMPGYPSGTNDDTLLGNIAWFGSNSASQTRPVGQLAGNGFGLHDMSGNVWEWVNDWYSGTYYASSPSVNPSGPSSGSARVLRGGSWGDTISGFCRSSERFSGVPALVNDGIGFRVARAP